MESIREIAQIYYEVMDENVKTKAVEFFNKMDNNKDGKVSMAEFAEFMTEDRYVAMNNTSFFKKINKNKNGELDFNDVKTLYYILESGRPLCRRCREFIEGTYFTCVKCFTCEAQSFCLHRRCFAKRDCVHNHEASNFVDNYALLEFIRKGLRGGDAQKSKSSKYNKSQGSASTSSAIVPSSKYNKSQGSASTSSAIVPSSKYNKSQGSASTSSAIVPRGDGRRRQQKDALQNLREAVGIAAQVVNAVGIVAAIGQCTIL